MKLKSRNLEVVIVTFKLNSSQIAFSKMSKFTNNQNEALFEFRVFCTALSLVSILFHQKKCLMSSKRNKLKNRKENKIHFFTLFDRSS